MSAVASPPERHRAQGSHGVGRAWHLSKSPVLGWSSLFGSKDPHLASVADLPNTRLTSSGRASLYQALRLLALPPGSTVLVPTYHCPTMIAPVLCAGLTAAYFGIDGQGLPQLDNVVPALRDSARAMIVAHYFGVPQDLGPVRAWCDRAGIALIEDCAHSLFGTAGGRPVGAWGDFATASISKFLPVPEMGLLASAARSLGVDTLQAPHLRAQVKGLIDVFESAAAYGQPRGLGNLLQPLFRWKNRNRSAAPPTVNPQPLTAMDAMPVCDMGRIELRPLAVSRWIHTASPLQRVVRRRQENFALYAELLQEMPSARALFDRLPDNSAPYVFPLWVEHGDQVYHSLRTSGLPVYRWDRVWPGTPALGDDAGPNWSRHIVQLLCHQDLTSGDIANVAKQVRRTLQAQPRQEP